MTFGVGFVAPYYAGIITDRRMSGASESEDADKCGYVKFADGAFAYTFSGLAAVPSIGFQTSEVLAGALCESGRPRSVGTPPMTVSEALPRVAQILSDAFIPLPVSRVNKRTSVVLAGYAETPDGLGQPQLWIISNFESLTEPPRAAADCQFLASGKDTNGVAVAWTGSSHYAAAARTQLLDLLERSRVVPPSIIAETVVDAIRQASALDPSVNGKCSSIFVPRASGPALIMYHSDEPEARIPATARVIASYGDDGAFVVLGQRLAKASYKGDPVFATVPVVHK